MRPVRPRSLATLALCLTIAVPTSALALGAKIGDDTTFVNVGLLLQPRADVTESGAPNGRDAGTELYLRRARIIVLGQLTPLVSFFVDTDNPNIGKAGDFSSSMYLQDAYMEVNAAPFLQVDVGLLLLPFSRQGATGATSLLMLDYHSSLIRPPTGSNRVWRDTGVMARGQLADKLLEYRLAVTGGVHGNVTAVDKKSSDGATAWTEKTDPRNNRDLPRVSGRLTANLFEPEGGPGAAGFFYKGVYLQTDEAGVISPKRILAIGVSADWQPELNITWANPVAGAARKVAKKQAYLGLAADAFLDMPVSADKLLGVTGQLDVYRYDYGTDPKPDPANPPLQRFLPGGKKEYSGVGLSAEAGAHYSAYGVVVGCDWFNADGATGDDGDLLAIYGGPVYWLHGHEANLKAQLGASRAGNVHPSLEKWIVAGSVQAQLVF